MGGRRRRRPAAVRRRSRALERFGDGGESANGRGAEADPLEAGWRRPRAEQQQAVESALPAELTRGRLHFVEVPSPLDAVSSSAIRSAIARGDVGAAREMLPACLHDYVDSEALFRESD